MPADEGCATAEAPRQRAVHRGAAALAMATALIAGAALPAAATEIVRPQRDGERTSVAMSRAERVAAQVSRSANGKFCPAPTGTLHDNWHDPRGGGRLHKGIDMSGNRGDPLVAIEDGVITKSESDSYGIHVALLGNSGHGYWYLHNERNLVKVGDRVKGGDVIALMGDTGSRGSVHLHFEWWPSGQQWSQENPYPLLLAICR
ncbi:MAG: M23 family metallopeptidase [Actinomycetales bacterium]|nr:M23 family metallopeptidase [Actinomycetales bacterium]